jgi:hypothetical protein
VADRSEAEQRGQNGGGNGAVVAMVSAAAVVRGRGRKGERGESNKAEKGGELLLLVFETRGDDGGHQRARVGRRRAPVTTRRRAPAAGQASVRGACGQDAGAAWAGFAEQAKREERPKKKRKTFFFLFFN